MGPADVLERATGALAITIGTGGLIRLRDQGCLKARFPRNEGGTQAILINSAGGIAGGDRLDCTITLAAGARATITGQAAERVYRARAEDDDARVASTVTIGEHAHLDWLPQELILFDGAALARRLVLRLASGASLTGVERLVLGRAAHGERVRRLRFTDLLRIERDGALLLHDATRLTDESWRRPAAFGPHRAAATLFHAGEDAPARLAPLRSALAEADAGMGIESGASLVAPTLLLARILAPDGASLRRLVAHALDRLRDGRHLPRVWTF